MSRQYIIPFLELDLLERYIPVKKKYKNNSKSRENLSTRDSAKEIAKDLGDFLYVSTVSLGFIGLGLCASDTAMRNIEMIQKWLSN